MYIEDLICQGIAVDEALENTNPIVAGATPPIGTWEKHLSVLVMQALVCQQSQEMEKPSMGSDC